MFIENVKVYYNGKVLDKTIGIGGDKINGLVNTLPASEKKKTINGKGLLVLPGLIDPHVHLREPGAEYKEDFYTGSRAAIAGGFTTVIDMPNNPKPTITLERLKEKIKLAKKKAICDVCFHFGASYDNFSEIIKVKPDSLKMYIGKSTGNLLIEDEKIIEKHFRNFSKNKPLVIHAEDQEYIEKTGDDGPESAYKAVEKMTRLAEKVNRVIYIAHCSTKKEIEIAKKYKKSLVEVTPHHLFLSKKDFGKLDYRRFVRPPLREEIFRKELWEILGEIDCIGSDHAPHLLEEKRQGAFGFPGLETSLHLFLDAYVKGLVKLEWIVEKMSENPAKIFNLKNKGKIEKEYYADLTFIDLKKKWVVKEEELETKCKWSPYNGKKLQGKVVGVMHKGKLRYWDEEFLT